MNAAAAAIERSRLEQLAARPNTKVLQVTHDFVAEPWAAQRVVSVTQRIIDQSLASEIPDDFDMRKALLRDEEIKAFQNQHPRMFWTLSDRKLMCEPKYRAAISAMLNVHRMVEAGVVAQGDYSNAVATQAVAHALRGEAATEAETSGVADASAGK